MFCIFIALAVGMYVFDMVIQFLLRWTLFIKAGTLRLITATIGLSALAFMLETATIVGVTGDYLRRWFWAKKGLCGILLEAQRALIIYIV